MKDLLPVTGYLRGGCSPVGMKKKFPTFFDASAQKWERISVSAGTRGEMVLVEPEQLRGIDQCCLYRADAITCAVWRIHMNS